MSNSAVVHFELECSPIDEDQLPFDRAIYSDIVSAGGHDWRMACTPEDVDGFVSVYLELISEDRNVVTVIFDAAITGSDQVVGPSCFSRRRTVLVYINHRPGDYERSGFGRFIHRADLGEYAGSNGRATVMCAVSVLDDYTLTSIADAPPLQEKKGIAALLSEVGDHLGCLLDSAALSDVSFVVGGDDEAPPLRAHRAILAARSPVFKAQFCGHMLEANTDAPSLIITVPDMDSETFKTMLRFMYTDNLPAGLGHDDEGEDEALLSLLAAADRYALDRLKLLCAQKLLSNMTVDTVATLLDCAETYNCPDLKTMCIEFVLDDENFDKVVLTDSFIDLVVTRSPLLLAEMRNIAFFRNNEKHIA
jgi:speckle-type POZ protein